MKYYYIPTTYRGRKFGKGLRGGSNTFQKAAAVGNALASKKVDPAAILRNIPAKEAEKAAKIIAKGELTGKPQKISKEQLGLWGRIKHDAAMVKKKWDDLSPTTKKIVKYTLAGLAGTYAGKKLIYDPRMRRMKEQYEKEKNDMKTKYEKEKREIKNESWRKINENDQKTREALNAADENYQREFRELKKRQREAEIKSHKLEQENELLREKHRSSANEEKRKLTLKYDFPDEKEKEEIKNMTEEEKEISKLDALNKIFKEDNYEVELSKKDGVAQYEKVHGPLDPRIDPHVYLTKSLGMPSLIEGDFPDFQIVQRVLKGIDGEPDKKYRYLRSSRYGDYEIHDGETKYLDPNTLAFTGKFNNGREINNIINATKAVESIANIKAEDLRDHGMYYDRDKKRWRVALQPSVKDGKYLKVFPDPKGDRLPGFEFVDPDEEELYGEQKICDPRRGNLYNWLKGCGFRKRKTYKKRTNNLKKKFHII